MKLMKFLPFLLLIVFLGTGCGSDPEPMVTGKLDVNYKLTYGGKPLQLFKNVAYPETGDSLFFSKVSFYLSNLSIKAGNQSTLLKDIDYLDVSAAHSTSTNTGFSYIVDNVPTGTYSALLFDIGVPKTQNAKTPNDFNGDSPLSRISEYWTAWKSYIFFRPEGKIAAPGSTTPTLNFALHLGGDTAYSTYELPRTLVINENETTRVNVEIDMQAFFKSTTYHDIRANRQIHSPEQEPIVVKLAKNLEASIK
jgi:hypothetical protein